MNSIVITGRSKGIGWGLANVFLAEGCQVTISSFAREEVIAAHKAFAEQYGEDRVIWNECDVTKIAQVEALWEDAVKAFGKVDIWINNAGIVNDIHQLWDVEPEEVARVVNTNVVGTLYGVRVAMRGLMEQGHGTLYNFYGFGSQDEKKPAGLTCYGSTKRAVRYITECLMEETKDGPVKVGALMPGTVITDFIFKVLRSTPKEEYDQMVKGFNIGADTIEDVTEFLAKEVLKNDEHGTVINWLTQEQFMARLEDPYYQNRDIFSDIKDKL